MQKCGEHMQAREYTCASTCTHARMHTFTRALSDTQRQRVGVGGEEEICSLTESGPELRDCYFVGSSCALAVVEQCKALSLQWIVGAGASHR